MARKPPSRIAKKKPLAVSSDALLTETALEQRDEQSVPEPQNVEPLLATPPLAEERGGKPVQQGTKSPPSKSHLSAPQAIKPQGAKSQLANQPPSLPALKSEPSGQILPLPQFLAQRHGLYNLGQIFQNLSTPELYEHILFLREGVMSAQGAVMVETAPNTKLAVRDKFIVEEEINKEHIAWGDANRAIDQTKFNALKTRLGAYLQRRNVYVQDCFAGSDTRWRVPLRIVTENAWQSLFVRNTFIEALPAELRQFEPRMTILCVPGFKAIPEIDGTRAETFVLYDFAQRLAIIGGTRHAEEIKKVVFTVMSYAMPLRRVLPMRCAASVSASGDTVLLFGTNGAGKTTLSADPARMLIGDDAHGWGDDGVFAFESGGYAKALGVSPETEPSIYAMSRMFGTILENVKFDPATRQPNLADTTLSDNGRISYSDVQLSTVQPITPKLRGAHPKNAIFLVNDAFGVLPPVARLSQEQAIFFYLSGYAAKNPIGDPKAEPKAVFSAAFGETFMVQDPISYSTLFRERLRRNNTKVWLVNTGWQGGTQATGSRIKREYTRAILSAITSGALDSVQYATDPAFNLSVPTACPGVPAAMLNPRNAWADRALYDKIAQKLFALLSENFKKYTSRVDKVVAQSLNVNVAPKAALKNTSQPKSTLQQPPLAEDNTSVGSAEATEPALQEPKSKKALPAKKAKLPKKVRGKAVPEEIEAPEGSMGGDFEAISSSEYSADNSTDVPIPPGLFASEPAGEFRPDDENPALILSPFDDDEDSDADSEQGESPDSQDGSGSQFKSGRRRRGGRGRRRPR